MQCDSAKIWLSDAPDADSRWSDHLASCARCRAEADRAAQLHQVMQTLPQVETPAALAGDLQQMAAATATRNLECAETLDLLESYREGLLTTAESFLVEDHLLWCRSCAEALEVADQLTTVLRALPQMVPPDSIAERLAQARLPWWQRLWTAPAPSWSLRRLLQVGGAMAAAALLFAVMTNLPEKANRDIATHPGAKTPPVMNPAPSGGDPVNANPGSVAMPGPIAVALPNVSARIERNTTDAVPTAKSRPESDIFAKLSIDPMAMPVAKALLPLAGFKPDAMIQPRDSAPKDRPVEAKIETHDDYRMLPPPPPEKNVSATAREKLLEMNNEYALARNEEELASLPDTMKSTLLLRPDAPRPSGPAPVLTASTDEVSRTVTNSLKRENPASLAPITVKSTHTPDRIGGTVFIIPMDSDG